jgi:hypothetical protein
MPKKFLSNLVVSKSMVCFFMKIAIVAMIAAPADSSAVVIVATAAATVATEAATAVMTAGIAGDTKQ